MVYIFCYETLLKLDLQMTCIDLSNLKELQNLEILCLVNSGTVKKTNGEIIRMCWEVPGLFPPKIRAKNRFGWSTKIRFREFQKITGGNFAFPTKIKVQKRLGWSTKIRNLKIALPNVFVK